MNVGKYQQTAQCKQARRNDPSTQYQLKPLWFLVDELENCYRAIWQVLIINGNAYVGETDMQTNISLAWVYKKVVVE